MIQARNARDRPDRPAKRYWPDSVFRIMLAVWLILGLALVVRSMLIDRPSLGQVLLVAWGVVVIVVLWFRLGPPRDHVSSVLR
jgi:hypothetical protein